MVFTAHSIQLNDGKMTMPWKTLLSETQMCQAIFRTLNRQFPPEIRHRIKVADLGTLEGGYAVEAARHGYQVTGFESRSNNFENCEFVKANLDLPNLNFVQDDVKNLDKYGKFDVILCLGLLYHLDNPVSFMKLLGTLTRAIVVVDTHYSQNRDFLYDFLPFLNRYKRMVTKRLSFLASKDNYALSALTRHEGRQGRWFKEYDKKASKNRIHESKWAASSNHRS
ncbi:MAG TPA: methyltransferase domain-containing protein, partial [Puia sp.]